MTETNEVLTPQENDSAWQARAARREEMRQNSQKQKKTQRTVLVGLIILLAAVVVLTVFFMTRPAAPADESAAPSASAAQAATTLPTETDPPTEPPTEPPTLPPVTWMTFEEGRALTAAQYFVYDVDAGEFVTISGSPTDIIYPASVTKVYTAYVAMQYLELDREITAGSALELVDPESSIAGIQYGDTFTTEKLVEAMLLPSGNDAACILAVETGRVLANDPELDARTAMNGFMDEVNRQMNLLGMTNTYFTNPDGIHNDNHHTSFADLATMGTLALENETIMKYASIPTETVTLGGVEGLLWRNTNSLINPDSDYYCPYALGLKTGQTSQAGSCLLSVFSCSDRTLLIGVFGCPERNDRFPDALQLFNETMGFPYAQPEPTEPSSETETATESASE